MPHTTTSGDPIADRRLAYALEYRAAGEAAAAAELIAQALERVPDWAAGWFALGEAFEAAGMRDRACEAYERAATLDPSDMAGAAPRRARLVGETPPTLPTAHVAALFDDYAGRFDSHLVGALGYRGPTLLMEAIDRVAPGRRFTRALDLGCGTGLMGRAVRHRVDHLAGVDVSAAMVAKARESGVYDALSVGDAVEALVGAWDLILAADVLVYLGDLTPLATRLGTVLDRGGIFAFTTERHDDEGYRLQASLRYAHGRDYLGACAGGAGLTVRTVEAVVTRRDAGADVPGWLCLWSRP